MPAEKKDHEPSGTPETIDEPQGTRVIQAPALPTEQPTTPVVNRDESEKASPPQAAAAPAPDDPTSPVWMTSSDLAVGRKQPEDAELTLTTGTSTDQTITGGPDTSQEGALRSARRDREDGPESASSLTAERLLAGTERPPMGGWRRWLYSASFGRINVGDSDKVRIARAMENRVGYRMGDRTRYVPILSRKGGVGKTTVTTLLGMVLADIREDRIIALDANPDRGTLSDRSPGRAEFTARQLVQNRFMVDSFSQLSNYVARDGSRLDVLASDTDPAVAQAFDDSDYRAVTDILGRYYSIVLTDSGTGMVHSVMNGTLDKADSVVLVSGGSVDEARLASETLSWLEAHGRTDLVSSAIVVINMSAGSTTKVNVDEIEEHFRSRVGTVVRLPYDPHLAEGSRVDLAKLRPATRMAATELSALVVDGLHS
ncbi:MinD/ParA family ATP-binding protein [Arthrobacter roseus]|uniref:MinD/ParA family ATP-binding protein n=1 Tax=Arthrobacter roseus TaxID=136274 RepID=UPI001965FC65|nr:MinD/ParA family protein [Arthrobacter roseus]MBM7848310.1 MinD-like ATPase involved in chromosome partitioning or flagellar assembly [Arthrobacter roseus]